MKEKNKICFYCSGFADTRDHIPSKNLLEKPYPNNLMTIDCCRKCNNSFSLDEEYFLNVLVEVSDNFVLQSKKAPGGNVYKARQRSAKLKSLIQNSLIDVGNGKIYFKHDNNRIKRIIEKNALGLFYYKYKKLQLPSLFNCTGFYPFTIEETRPAEVYMLTHYQNFKPKKWTTIQWDVFSYIIVRDWRRNNKLTMIFHIHNSAWCIIEIPSPKRSKNKQDPNQFRIFD